MLTTWACFTEAMYLLGRDGGYRYQEILWGMFDAGTVNIHEPGSGEAGRMRVLMRQYQDTPMDFTDASVVSAEEVLGVRRVFTCDRHFYAYRTSDGKAFEVIP